MKNAGAAISSRRVGVNILRTGGLKNFRTEEKGDQPGGGGGGLLSLGGHYPITCHVCCLFPTSLKSKANHFDNLFKSPTVSLENINA